MINLAHPYVTEDMRNAAYDKLGTRFIGQGEKVNEFEKIFQEQLKTNPAVAVGSGTDALHIAYILAGIKHGDEVLVPVFTCTATNNPLLWIGAKIVFVDCQKDTLNIDPEDIKRKITKNTKAIVTVDYAGQPCDYNEIFDIAEKHGIPVIQDASHSIGALYNGIPVGALSDFTTFSFQAIKHISTPDGGMLTIADQDLVKRAKLIRWFGIDREKKLENIGHWTNDIEEVGYKYQMNDVVASMGIESLKVLDKQLARRAEMVRMYKEGLNDIPEIEFLQDKPDRVSANWLMTILANDRDGLRDYLYGKGVESSPFHYRNDQYSTFKNFRNHCPNMDSVENKILCIPLRMSLADYEINLVINHIRKYYIKDYYA